jgi:hypothetical protein
MSPVHFTPIPAKPTFGSKQQNLYSSDYIKQKKMKIQYCNIKPCTVNPILLNASNVINTVVKNQNDKLYNTSNLNINLYTKLDLKNVNVIENNFPIVPSTTIDPSLNFNENYTIDPSGVLFGNTTCGINNFVHYQVPI